MRKSWHHALASALSVPALSEDGAEFEIAFGRLRAAVVYVLELARAHRLAATGNVAGDDVWLALGNSRVRFTLNRRESLLVIRKLRGEQRLVWNTAARAVVDTDGKAQDLMAIAQSTIDELVLHWQKEPSQRFASSSGREFDDEPTKG